MSGLLLIGVAALWFWFVLFISRWIVKKTKTPWIRRVNAAVIFSVLLVAPLGDEIVGKYQFEALCKKYAVQYIDKEHAVNRRVFLELPVGDRVVKGTAVRIRLVPWLFKDVETQKILVSYHTLQAEGGWLIRRLGISETKSPLLFERGCSPVGELDFREKFNITVVN